MKIFCDGSCVGNGTKNSHGGYGVVIFDDNDNYITHYSHHEDETTNNIQELKSLIYSFLIAYQHPFEKIYIYSDSSYGIQVFETWCKSWKHYGWQKYDRKPIKNLELIKEGYEIYLKLKNIEIIKVKGHNNVLGNEMADALATNNMKKFNKLLNGSV